MASQVQVAWSAPLGTDAAEADDLGTTSGTLTFAADSAAESTQSITITATDDMLSEGAESFTVTLGAITTKLPATQVVVKSDENSATATIAESDPITVSISGPSSVDEGDATTDYTVSLSPDGVTPTADLTVSYATGGRHGDSRRQRLHREVGYADVHQRGCGVADVHGADEGGHHRRV